MAVAAVWTWCGSDRAGSVAGGVLTTRLQPRHPMRAEIYAAVMVGFPPLAFAAGFGVPAIAASAALAGTGVIVFLSHYNSTMQRQVLERSLSRVTMLLAVGSLMILAILPLLGVRSIWNLTDESPALPMPQIPER
jgi:hypothetical protein